MSDSAAEAAERDAVVLRLGASGRGRVEIAAALGMTPAALAAHEAEDAALAAALAGAADLALAWWEAIAREACEAGKFSFAAWTREMRRRFGETAPEGAPRGAARPPAAAPQPAGGAVYLIPCNGRLRKDGTCPCAGYESDEQWRAEVARYYAQRPELNLDHDEDEDEDDDDYAHDDENDWSDEEETFDDEQL
jgi:hypothetical protein